MPLEVEPLGGAVHHLHALGPEPRTEVGNQPRVGTHAPCLAQRHVAASAAVVVGDYDQASAGAVRPVGCQELLQPLT